MKPTRMFFYGYVVLAICFGAMVAGYMCRNTFSVFYPAIVEEFAWSRSNTALIYSINILVYGMVAPFAGRLADRFRPRYVLATGAFVTGLGITLCSLASERWQFYLLYGVISAIGFSIAGWVPVATLLTNWFMRRRGLVFGVLGAGFGLSIVGAFAAQYAILSLGWRTAYVIMGLFVAVIIPPACIHVIRRYPADMGLYPDGVSATEWLEQEARAAEIRAASPASVRDWTLRDALKARRFWLLFLIWICTMGITEQVVISQQVFFYLDAGYSPLTAATFYAIFGLSMAAGNLFGSFSDRVGREHLSMPSFLLCLALTGLLFLMRDATTPWLPFLFALGFGFSFGALSCVLNATVADIFHGAHYGSIAGMLVFGFAIGGCISPWLSGLLYDLSGGHTYTYSLIVVAQLASIIMYRQVVPKKVRAVRQPPVS